MTDAETQLYHLYAQRGEAVSERDRLSAEVKQLDNAMAAIVATLPGMRHSIPGVAAFGISAPSAGYTYDKGEIDLVIATLRQAQAVGTRLAVDDVIQMLLEAQKPTSRAGSFYCRPAKERA
jgi:hypothetical protein